MYATRVSNRRCFDPATNPLKHIPRLRGLSRDEEREVAALVAAGDQAARNRLVLANLGLVIMIARRFQGHGLALDDLVGEGNLGLIRAAEDYDPDYGTRFSTYAGYWIKQAIRDALINRAATIRLPAHIVRLLTRWDRAEQFLCQEKKSRPSFDEVAEYLGLTESEQKLVQRAKDTCRVKHEGAIQAHQGEWSAEEAVDTYPLTDESIKIEEDREDLAARMRCLDERELRVLESRFGLGGESPLTLKEVGKDLGLTKEWIRIIEQRAIRKLGATSSVHQSFSGIADVPA
jgi:RNA polymerase primary sigma factor